MELCQLSQRILVQGLPLCCVADNKGLHIHYKARHRHTTYTDKLRHILYTGSFAFILVKQQKKHALINKFYCTRHTRNIMESFMYNVYMM